MSHPHPTGHDAHGAPSPDPSAAGADPAPRPMSACPGCSSPVPPDSRFCPTCGSPMPDAGGSSPAADEGPPSGYLGSGLPPGWSTAEGAARPDDRTDDRPYDRGEDGFEDLAGRFGGSGDGTPVEHTVDASPPPSAWADGPTFESPSLGGGHAAAPYGTGPAYGDVSYGAGPYSGSADQRYAYPPDHGLAAPAVPPEAGVPSVPPAPSVPPVPESGGQARLNEPVPGLAAEATYEDPAAYAGPAPGGQPGGQSGGESEAPTGPVTMDAPAGNPYVHGYEQYGDGPAGPAGPAGPEPVAPAPGASHVYGRPAGPPAAEEDTGPPPAWPTTQDPTTRDQGGAGGGYGSYGLGTPFGAAPGPGAPGSGYEGFAFQGPGVQPGHQPGPGGPGGGYEGFAPEGFGQDRYAGQAGYAGQGGYAGPAGYAGGYEGGGYEGGGYDGGYAGQGAPPYDGGIRFDDGRGDHDEEARRWRLVALVGGAVLLVVVVFIGGGLFLFGDRNEPAKGASGGSSAAASPTGTASLTASPSPSATGGDAKTQAAAVDAVLAKAVKGKGIVTSTYNDATGCSISPAAAEKRFKSAAANRRATVAAAKKLDVSALDGGARVRRLIVSTYTTSARADDAFASWAAQGDAKGSSCLKPTGTSRRGNSLSISTRDPKRALAKAWNPLASRYGLPKRSAGTL